MLTSRKFIISFSLLINIVLSGCASNGIFLMKGKSENSTVENSNRNNAGKKSGLDTITDSTNRPKVDQERKLGSIPVAENQNIFDEIANNFRLPNLPASRVNRQVKVFTRNPEYLTRMFARSTKYLHFVHKEVQSRNLPSEIALLPFVESAYNPHATSRAKAAGLWQFIPSTGRRYELKQTWWTDERRTVMDSTYAALDYLEYLYKLKSKDWFLALASYNWGERSVRKAIEKNKRARKKTNYSSLRMPRETRNYVPKLLAMREIIRNPTKYGLELPVIPNVPYFRSVAITDSLDVDLISELSEIDEGEFLALNANVLRPVVNKKHTRNILLPYGKYDIFKSNLRQFQKTQQSLVGWIPLKLKDSASVNDIAKKFGNDAHAVAKANGIRSLKTKLLKGSSIIVATNDKSLNTSAKIENFNKAKLKFLYPDHIFYKVRKGDTLSHIATRYRISVKSLKRLNNLRGNLIRVGQRLRVRGGDNLYNKNTHTVRKGESLYQIAKRYRTTVRELKRLNKLASDIIISGSNLIIRN